MAASKDLFEAVKDKVKILLQNGKYDVNKVDCDRPTPLYYACERGDLEMVRMLVLELNANVNATCIKPAYPDDIPSTCPLHVAVLYGKEEMALALITEFGAECNVKDRLGQSVLHYACRRGNVSLVRTLCEYKADVNAYNNDKETPLCVAAENRWKVIALALINEFGADCDVKDRWGQPVLHKACRQGDVSLVRALCEHKANVNACDNYRETPLCVAAENEQEEIALVLINEFSADCNVKDRWGQSVLHNACRRGNVSLVRALCGHKANVNACDNCKETPLCIAAENRWKELALVLINEFGADCNVKDRLGQSVLHKACRQGDVSLVRALCEHKANVNACDNHKETPLFVAAENEWEEIALALVNQFDADTNVKDRWGQTALHNACRQGNVSLVRALCEHKADVNAYDNDKKTPLFVATENRKQEIALVLITEFGADCNVKDKWGQSVLHYACRQDNIIHLVRTLCEHNANVNAYNNDRETPLCVAVEYGKEEIALALIKFGTDCNIKDRWGQPALHNVCRQGNVSLVRNLCEHKADVNAYNSDQKTPLHVAAENGKEEIALALIKEFGADCNFRDRWGQSVYHYACRRGNISLVRALCNRNADVNSYDDYKKTPLFEAAENGKKEIALVLITEFGADCNVKDSKGQSVLHYACRGGNVSLVCILIREHKADVNAYDYYNKTPLFIAAENGNEEVLLALITEFRADYDVKDKLNRSVLHYACRQSSISLVQTLCEHNADVNSYDDYKETPLFVAAENGEEEIALALINEFGADCNVKDSKRRSVLHHACRGGNVSLVLTLVREHKADNMDAYDSEHKSPILVAAENGKEEMALMLINVFGADYHVKD